MVTDDQAVGKVIRIEDLAQNVGQEVTVRGWLYAKTDKGRLQFLQVRDGTGIVQVVAFKRELSPQAFEMAQTVTQESSLVVTGTVRADERAPGYPGGYEIGLRDMRIVQLAGEYPITPKEHGVEFLMEHRHLWLRSSRQWAILRIRATIIKAIRNWLDDNGFLLVDTPLLTPAACEGTTTLFETDYFGTPAFLSQSGQLYNEATIGAFGKTYCFGPAFRAEKSKTRRHVMELWMVEPEAAYVELDECMEIEEQLISHIVQTVLRERRMELDIVERDVSYLERIAPPFPRLSYDEAVKMINDLGQAEGIQIEWGEDFGAPQETLLSDQFDRPVFVHHYPTAVKAFYMAQEPDRPEVCRSVDLLAPEGYGEIIGGGERSGDPEFLSRQIETHNLPRDAYKWYLELRQYGGVPHSGFGLGIERTVCWICKLPHIRESIAFPRMLGQIYP
jgi:asparaginyl-tRNA synthetase